MPLWVHSLSRQLVSIYFKMAWHIAKSFNVNEHCEKLLIKANQQFGILKRTCHFVTNKNRRRVLYLALVRSQFEHCSPIWRPCGNTMINKFENFQKKCIKWILSELELSYSNEVYLRKCKQVNILPLLYRFMFNDMNLFHKVVYKIIPVTMPDYLTLYSGDSRLRRPQYTPWQSMFCIKYSLNNNKHK